MAHTGSYASTAAPNLLLLNTASSCRATTCSVRPASRSASVSPTQRIDVNPAARTFRAEGGCNWGEVNDALQPHGLAATGGKQRSEKGGGEETVFHGAKSVVGPRATCKPEGVNSSHAPRGTGRK